MADLQAFHGPNAGYVLELYERFRHDPDSVDPSWRDFFHSFTPPAPGQTMPAAGPVGEAGGADIERLLGARELARRIRGRGHTAARLDPLGSEPQPDTVLQGVLYGISEADLAQVPAEAVRGPASRGAGHAAEAIARLREVYTGSVGYEFSHIPNAEERGWLRERVESEEFLGSLGPEEERGLLERLSRVEGFERYLHKTFFGQKRFSIEGTDMLVPMLDTIIQRAAESGSGDVLIGMAHRGRLNVLTHVLEKPYEKMLAGFLEARAEPTGAAANSDLPSGDVKYHMGWQTERRFGDHRIRVTLSPNPSHLEFVDPVVVGMTRAAQDDTKQQGPPEVDPDAAVPVLVHGDTAFAGQGVVAETFNLSGLPGYEVGGTIHIIANNQIGFTTDPEQGRSTYYASDLAKGFELPIVHVNADDAEACVRVAMLAHAYRERWAKDFVIDLVGYRRWGHNEGDEPAFTQPRMYDVISDHPTVRAQLADKLVERGVVTREEADGILQAALDRLAEVQDAMDAEAIARALPSPSRNGRREGGERIETGVDAAELRELNESLLKWPEGFSPHPRLARLLERRREALDGEPAIDWGHAEALAFASLLAEGTPVRLTGQDAERGTFSHRHLILHGVETGERLDVLAHLPQAKASFEIRNSPLSEMAAIGFEYGYSVYDPQALVLWEAQFGDFVNGAQVMIDQYISSSYQKWGQSSGLMMLLPHGYEGQGPEHSSARLERFLQLAAENNLRVVNPTTSAQYFHLLRRQAGFLEREEDVRPLIMMSPKSLLRHPLAASRLEQLASGHFQCVIRDETVADRAEQITRLLLCSGKVHVDLVSAEVRDEAEQVALARVEELYPFPASELRSLLDSFPALGEVVWVQEEPKNMGAWRFVEPRLRELVDACDGVALRYIGRPERASPAEGSAARHKAEQERIVSEAWGRGERGKGKGERGEGTEKREERAAAGAR